MSWTESFEYAFFRWEKKSTNIPLYNIPSLWLYKHSVTGKKEITEHYYILIF